ncbi:hypothetical protein SAMN05444380_10340 [Thermophagus xiamenensis]|uniref:Uncharacterized protein n=1 Tax=Thermophagus xiamenensis TaxID=385682 RepID=A0A1I1VSA6_9BACT|nr:hypothetical protein SAMN05444380_10340 [Thermophagus xiamenensis]
MDRVYFTLSLGTSDELDRTNLLTEFALRILVSKKEKCLF